MSLLATQKLAVQATGGPDKFETRLGNYGSWAKVLRDSQISGGIITPEMQSLVNQSNGRTFQTNVLEFNNNVALTATRTVNLTPAVESSQRITATATTLQGTISVIPALHASNEIDMERSWINSYRSLIKKFAVQLNTLANTYLDTNKADATAETLGHTFNGTLDELVVDYTERLNILGDSSIIMNANDYYDTLDVVGNSRTQQLVNAYKEKGVYNMDDKTFHYNDKNFFFDHQMGSDSGYNAQFFLAPVGSTGVLIRQEQDALMGHVTTNGRRFGVVFDDILGIPMSEYAYSEVIDASGLHGAASSHLSRTMVQLYSYSFEVLFIPPFTSANAGNAPILKVSVADAL
jgi:hypothetical protein